MQTTVTVHWNKGYVAREHNQRNEELCSHEKHIDLYNRQGDSSHEVWVRTDLTDAYRNIFGDAIDNYNKKQKRADRRLSVESYMELVANDTRGRRQTKIVNGKRVIDEDSRRGKQLSYELVVMIGNSKPALDDDGRVMYDGTGHRIRPQALPRDVTRRIQKRYVDTFQASNPNLMLVNADYHADESFDNLRGQGEYGTDHTHLEVIPIATGFKQGLEVQNSMNKALRSMGFLTDDGYSEWARSEQKRLEAIVHEEYEKYCMDNPDYAADKGLLEIIHPVADRTEKGDRNKETYVLEQELNEQIAEYRYLNKQNKQKSEEMDAEKQEMADYWEAMKEVNQELQQEILQNQQLGERLQRELSEVQRTKELKADKKSVIRRYGLDGYEREF